MNGYLLIIHIDAVVTPRQGELRGKVHLSHRCFALEAWNASRLRRRQPSERITSGNPIDANNASLSRNSPCPLNSLIIVF
jgi:hypothetical protein